MKMLTADEARCFTSCTEDIIEFVCHGCIHANLDLSALDFCPIQAEYGMKGEHPAIVCRKVVNGLRVKCLFKERPPRKQRTPSASNWKQLNLFADRA